MKMVNMKTMESGFSVNHNNEYLPNSSNNDLISKQQLNDSKKFQTIEQSPAHEVMRSSSTNAQLYTCTELPA